MNAPIKVSDHLIGRLQWTWRALAAACLPACLLSLAAQSRQDQPAWFDLSVLAGASDLPAPATAATTTKHHQAPPPTTALLPASVTVSRSLVRPLPFIEMQL